MLLIGLLRWKRNARAGAVGPASPTSRYKRDAVELASEMEICRVKDTHAMSVFRTYGSWTNEPLRLWH